jgi:hypothetical protein
MNDPIKIIFKYKNNNRRLQYHLYVFVGEVKPAIMTILNKIQDKNLYNSLIELTTKEVDKMIKKYGDKWYKKFFNTYHINHTISTIRTSLANQLEIKKKFGEDWYKAHIEKHKLISKDLYYNYEVMIKQDKERKQSKKNKNKIIEEELDINYKTLKGTDIQSLYSQYSMKRISSTDESSDSYLEGGGEDDDDYSNDTEEQDSSNKDSSENVSSSFEEGLDTDEYLEEEEMDLEDIESMYKNIDVDPDKNIIKTTDLIQKALKDNKLFKTIDTKMINFDQSKDNLIHDDSLKNVYFKNYVVTQYIFKDDTVKAIKNKITCSVKNNSKFGKHLYLIPSRQYLWSEYFFDNKVEKVMIGHKWIKRNELLHIDVEPNTNLRIYEELRGNLKLLRDNIKRYGSKIKREDDDFNILYDYAGYYTNNEIYMLDIYNEIGDKYHGTQESVKNIADVFVKVYFPKIKTDDVKHIIEYLNNEPSIENNKITSVYDTIKNDLVLENEIMKEVETTKALASYQHIFKDNYITQSVIHVSLRLGNNSKIDLFRIFNEFIVNKKYPFVQYHTPDGQIIYKFEENIIYGYHKNKDNMEILSKWFESEPYGISFKVKVIDKGVEKFMAINLNDNGRIEYKTRWKEDEMATIKDIKHTYSYIKELIEKINKEKNKVKIEEPSDNEFRYAFINTIQKFILPEKFIINHNDLSEFSRYFFPYVALVIEPRKRQSKIQKVNTTSKFGTYLRYKRVSKYENQARIEQRILYFMRNYDYNDQSLANEISKQFNITDERSMEEIERVRSKYTNIKKSRKVLKKLENIPKYKPPGIGIDIQGKHRDKYKIRISGARNKQQLDRIITFMNILIYLYTETYLYKKPEKQSLKEKLKSLTNIAKRRNKVNELVDYNKAIKTVKQMTQLDKKRIGFKPEKGQNQWTRSCQNSGDDKRRRPQQYTSLNIEKLLKKGYVLNKKTKMYEKKVPLKKKKGKFVTIRAVKLPDFDAQNATDDIYYACSPQENGDHMFIGFLTRSNNPYGHCMPCCFKKDPMISKNKEKREYFLKCIGHMKDTKEKINKTIGDKLYILQDTNKIQEGRFGFLPKYLDFYFNYSIGKSKKIKHHYLISTTNGYFFKYGSRQDTFPFLNAISSILDISIDTIKNKISIMLEKDKGNNIFTALNNGDIKTQFMSRDKYMLYIKTNTFLSFDTMNHIISLPRVLMDNGLNIIVFEKVSRIIKTSLDKQKIQEDFVPICQNIEEYYNINDPTRKTIFLLKENHNYYPIVMVQKDDNVNKNVAVAKLFNYKKEKTNIVHHIKDYYTRNCFEGSIEDIGHRRTTLTAKKLLLQLNEFKTKDYKAKSQIIDIRNKCKYIVTHNMTIIPVKPSGSIYNLQISKNLDDLLQNFTSTIKNLSELYKISDKNISVKPIGIYHESKKSTKDSYYVVAVMTKSYDIVPIKQELISMSKIKKYNFIVENKPLFDKIDKEISKGRENFIPDKRIKNVNYDKYYNESYQLFRLELSEFINNEDNVNLRNKLIKIIDSVKLDKKQKRVEIKRIIFKLSDKDLHTLFNDTIEKLMRDQKGGKYDRLMHIRSTEPNLIHYQVSNNRDLCTIHANKESCNKSVHCHWSHNTCYLSLTKDITITFINKVSEELAEAVLKAQELLKVGPYFVSDIVDYNRFTERADQKIVKSSNYNLKKVLGELFGKNNIPKIGKRRMVKSQLINYQQMNIDNPLKDMRDFYIQNVIENNLSIFRGYVNGFYWLKHSYYDVDSRNLGYYSDLQTDLANYFRSLIIDWLIDNKDRKSMHKLLKYIDTSKKKNIIDDFTIKLGNDVYTLTNCIIELHVLSKIQKDIPIIVLNDDSKIQYIFSEGLVYDLHDKTTNLKNIDEYKNNKYSITLRFSFISSGNIPDEIEIIYYK